MSRSLCAKPEYGRRPRPYSTDAAPRPPNTFNRIARMRPLPRSAALPASHSLKDFIDVSLSLSLLDELVVRLACWSDTGYDQIEVESADQLQALDVPLPVADPVEHRGPPTAPDEEYRVAREQDAMLPRIPEEGGGPGRVSGDGDDFEVIVELVALGEGLFDVAGLGGRWCILLVDVKRSVERLCDPIAGGRGFAVVVEVLPPNAAEVVYRFYVLLEGGGPVDEQVALLALEQIRPDLE